MHQSNCRSNTKDYCRETILRMRLNLGELREFTGPRSYLLRLSYLSTFSTALINLLIRCSFTYCKIKGLKKSKVDWTFFMLH